MLEDEEIAVLVGFLTVKSQNGFSIRNSKKPKYFQLFKASRNGIERLEISDSENDRNTRIVTLENCVKIVLEQPPINIITIVTKTGQIQLHSLNNVLIKQWKIALQSVAFKAKSSPCSILSSSATIEEDNDLYCSSYSEGIFAVTLIPTDASIKCGLEPKLYTLRLTSSDILLKCYNDESITVAMWPYRFVRKYGYRDGKFTFEAGRMCDTGEGTFKLENVNPQEIFRCMATIMKSMKNKMNSGKTNQSKVALPMEPGSRSPLPSTSHGTFIDIEFPNSFRGITFSDVMSIASTNSVPCIRNGMPSKPPRKSAVMESQASLKLPLEQRCQNISNVSSVFIQNSGNCDSQSEVVDVISFNVPSLSKDDRDYECVEDITDAWKKLGIDEINHTENTQTIEELGKFAQERSKLSRELYTYRLDMRNVNDEMKCRSYADDSYDKLNFFRITHKTCPEYRTVFPIKLQDTISQQSAKLSDDYEIVGEPPSVSAQKHSFICSEEMRDNANQMPMIAPDISMCRKADDSYLGYGMIRKPNVQVRHFTSITCASPSNLFKIENELDKNKRFEDTTTSKPKRV
ncbi:uncharacterized protein LOC131681526 [Topomyia yanbarensis]|uniref:uncharacterized protein LOC131681526 n=1 Tax=Topomyia yanbarensis TaxID=2498891 RepID=UPI00273C595D|nr:uncharacterized protein LOC131681526 [Topomyia yanbarensis]